jgi:hypothetical protein
MDIGISIPTLCVGTAVVYPALTDGAGMTEQAGLSAMPTAQAGVRETGLTGNKTKPT